jgi:hypothetical protein
MSSVKYDLGFYSPEDTTFHSHRRENLRSYIALTGWALWRRRNVFPVRYELSFYIRFEVFTAVTMKNGVFWDVTPCGFVRTDVSEELSVSFIRVTRIRELGTTLAVTSHHSENLKFYMIMLQVRTFCNTEPNYWSPCVVCVLHVPTVTERG